MRVARERLNKQFIQPGTASDPRLDDAVASLAAEICAYGELAEEGDGLDARADEPLIRE